LLKKSIRGLFQHAKQKARFLLCFIVQTRSVFEQWRYVPIPHRRVLKNEFFSTLLIKKLTINKKITKPKKRKQGPKKSATRRASSSNDESYLPPADNGFCIVGLGASAGGLEALEHFFKNMPDDSGLAFVIVQHLDPDHSSILVDLIKHHTNMQVFQIKDGMRIAPNCVYVIPPNKDLALLHGMLHLIDLSLPHGFRLPIDHFFRSLAEDQRHKAIGIVLSGTGTDGSLGVKAIKAAGGMTMAQEGSTAKYDGMPRSAIVTGCIDYVLPAKKMPAELVRYVRHPYVSKVAETEAVGETHLEKIFILLRSRTGHDFTYYKRNTIDRRIERRMAVHQIKKVEDYLRYLQQNKHEIEALFKELLIGVTNFFRDPESFEVLKQKVIPRILQPKSAETPIRVWVTGCSTGEEAYSVAMVLIEAMNDLSKNFKIHIFATDIDEQALAFARIGAYPESIVADVSADRLRHFFSKEGHTYQIRKQLREMIIFAKQDVLKDPPFSKLDLILCRNLLIYLGLPLQKKLLPLFHYTLDPGGFLMLGPSETIGEFADLFSLVDKKWKIFQRKSALRASVEFPPVPLIKGERRKKESAKSLGHTNVVQLSEKLLLEGYTPSCVIINEKDDIIHFHGHTSRFLEPPTGEATLNILKMAREDIRIELRSAIHKAFKRHTTVAHPNVVIKEGGREFSVNLIVKPFQQESMQGLMMVIFEDVNQLSQHKPAKKSKTTSTSDQRLYDLEFELDSTKESLQRAIEELETSNEELKSTNEELQSTNEELQSSNEELETSREELQSINEELMTVNAELQTKLDELSQANNDMVNLLNSTNTGTIFLDNQLRIKRFTPAVAKVINLISSDIGRPINHLTPDLVYPHLVDDINQVLKTLVFKEQELHTRDGDWFSMRIFPYRTMENVIDGVVVTFVDISGFKKQQLAKEAALAYAHNILSLVSEPVLVLNKNLQIIAANEGFYRIFRLTPPETLNRSIYALGSEWNIPALKGLLQQGQWRNGGVEDLKIEQYFPIVNQRMSITVRKLTPATEIFAGENELVLLAINALD